ncbi:MAG TPA: hypothetical protein ENI23_15320, partial [bacterium]|nr:hypothetical protein [bacterium]
SITYTGRFPYIIQVDGKTLIPDFVVDGKKKVIETFGRYWHTEENIREKIELYKKAGYECLSILEPIDKSYNKFAEGQLGRILEFTHNGYEIVSIKEIDKSKKGRYSSLRIWDVVNLHCEPYNNFFVNGVLAHNCNYGEMWENDKIGLMERNIRHVRWIKQIDEKMKVIDYYWILKEIVGLEELEGTGYSSTLFDTLLLRHSSLVLPSKSHESHTKYEGAYVMQPQSGVYDNIAIFDLTRFYPQILLSELLDPAILDSYKKQNGDSGWDGYKDFAQKYISDGKPAVWLDIVRDMSKERVRLQNLPEHREKLAGLKGILNSAYGVLASPAFRLYSPDIPERITEVARNTIQSLAEDVRRWGYEVIYADTDSIFAQVPRDKVDELEQKLNDKLSDYGDFSIKLDDYAVKILFTGAKKKYCLISEDGEIHITGFEFVRSDASNFTKGLQEEIIRMVLTGRENEIVEFLKLKTKEIKSCKLEDIAISKTLSKELKEYTGTQQNYILAAKQAPWLRDLKQGDAVKIVYAKNYPHSVAVYQDESDLPDKVDVDFDKIIDAQITKKVEGIIEQIGISWKEIQGQRRLL